MFTSGGAITRWSEAASPWSATARFAAPPAIAPAIAGDTGFGAQMTMAPSEFRSASAAAAMSALASPWPATALARLAVAWPSSPAAGRIQCAAKSTSSLRSAPMTTSVAFSPATASLMRTLRTLWLSSRSSETTTIAFAFGMRVMSVAMRHVPRRASSASFAARMTGPRGLSAVVPNASPAMSRARYASSFVTVPPTSTPTRPFPAASRKAFAASADASPRDAGAWMTPRFTRWRESRSRGFSES